MMEKWLKKYPYDKNCWKVRGNREMVENVS